MMNNTHRMCVSNTRPSTSYENQNDYRREIDQDRFAGKWTGRDSLNPFIQQLGTS